VEALRDELAAAQRNSQSLATAHDETHAKHAQLLAELHDSKEHIGDLLAAAKLEALRSNEQRAQLEALRTQVM
jgi:hypothetical protein